MANYSPSSRPTSAAAASKVAARSSADSVRSSPVAGASPSGRQYGHGNSMHPSSAGRRPGAGPATAAAGYPGLHELVEERFFPFVQQVVGFLGIGLPDQNNCEVIDSQGNPDPSKSSEGRPISSTGASGLPEGADPALLATGSDNGRSSFDEQCLTTTTTGGASSSYGYDDLQPAGAGEEKLGRIQFSLQYNSKDMVLTLKVMKAAELAAKDFSGTSDPYVKILLLPDKKNKLQTNVKRKNLNPRWNETFAFEGFPYAKLISRTLYLQVFDYDRFSRDDPIGEVCLPLSEIDLSTCQTMWKTLQPCKGAAGKLGELLVSLNYQPSVGVISIGIIKARSLKAKDINGLSDPYVKIWLMHDGKRVEKKKTPVKEKDLNPVFEETIMFTVPYEKIRQTTLIVSVMDYDRIGRNEPIGQLVLGSKSGPMEVKHWNEMFAKSRTDVVKWHILKDLS